VPARRPGVAECLVVHRWPAKVVGATRVPNTPTMRCASRHAMVVTGAGLGSEEAKSITNSPPPAAIAARPCPRGWIFQVSATGSQKYSSSVSPS
jgi:hypothetical protein